MKTMLGVMKKRKNGIPEDVLSIFENIEHSYNGMDCDNKFMEAIGEYFDEGQRFQLWEQHGGCQGTGQDKRRKAFALEHANAPLPVRLELFISAFTSNFSGKTRNIVLDEENNTITVTFACDECYKHTLDGKLTAPLALYYESCAGGRMYGLEKALGVKLKIKSADIPSQDIGNENPCAYTYDIVSE